MSATSSANPIDVHVGARIEMRRAALGLTRQATAQALNLTEQQVEAFESGAVRVDASTLYEIADLFDVRVAYFFEVDGFGSGLTAAVGGFHELDRAN